MKEGDDPASEEEVTILLDFELNGRLYKGTAKGEKMPFNTTFDCNLNDVGNFSIDQIEFSKWELIFGSVDAKLVSAIGKQIEGYFQQNES